MASIGMEPRVDWNFQANQIEVIQNSDPIIIIIIYGYYRTYQKNDEVDILHT